MDGVNSTPVISQFGFFSASSAKQPGPDAQFEHLLPVSDDCVGGSGHGVVVVVTTSHQQVVAIVMPVY